jgi:hypothetical protein
MSGWRRQKETKKDTICVVHLRERQTKNTGTRTDLKVGRFRGSEELKRLGNTVHRNVRAAGAKKLQTAD